AKGQRCVIPAEAIYEPCFESGQAVQSATVAAIEEALIAAGVEMITPGGKSVRGGAGVRLIDPS
uniref:hypothetical protein n=1 Tax=Sphingomonas sp. TaxID=28214 RepID=UPI0025EB0351